MKASIIPSGLSVALAAVVPVQRPLLQCEHSESQSLCVDSSGSNTNPSTAFRTAFVDPEEHGLGFDASQQWSGYLDSGSDTNLFFWMFESRRDPANDPVILWLGGHPGHSSLFGALEQWGPKRILIDGSFTENLAALNEAATIVFLDHLVGTGFSYSKHATDIHNTRQSSANVISFLEAFIRTSFGGMTFAGRELHIGGEYYAGHYVPNIARAIVSRPPNKRFNLKSIMIGNGWFDALAQQTSVYQQLCDAALTSNLDRMLSNEECSHWLRSIQDCERCIVECRSDITRCTPLEETCSQSDVLKYVNVRHHNGNELIEHHDCERHRHRIDDRKDHLTRYLMDARDSLGVGPTSYGNEKRAWKLDGVGTLRSFKDSGDYTQNSVPDLSALLSTAESGIHVLLFAGTEHLQAPYLGTKTVAQKLDWSGHDAFYNISQAPHYAELRSVDGNNYGEYVRVSDSESRTLMSAAIYGAGDMADEKTGVQVKALLYRWIFDHDWC